MWSTRRCQWWASWCAWGILALVLVRGWLRHGQGATRTRAAPPQSPPRPDPFAEDRLGALEIVAPSRAPDPGGYLLSSTPYEETLEDVISWEYWDAEEQRLYTDRAGAAGYLSAEELPLADTEQLQFFRRASIEALQRVLGVDAAVDQRNVVGLHRRFHRAKGLSYIAAFAEALKGQGSRTVSLLLDFDGALRAEVGKVDTRTRISVIVPVKGRWAALQQFVRRFRASRPLERNLHLVVACFGSAKECTAVGDFIAGQLTTRDAPGPPLERARDAFAVVAINKGFSRAEGLQVGAAQVPSDEILFFCDVDMLVEYGFYSRCRDHAREGSQAYFPIVYSMYPGAAEVGQNQGRWRTQGYGMACMYAADFVAVGGYERASDFVGWGKEDVDLYARFLQSRYSIFRGFEPGLRHLWHPKTCGQTEARDACTSSVLDDLGAQETLARALVDHGIDMQRLDVTLSRKMVAGAEPSDFVAEWERKLRAKSRRKRPQAPVVENFVLQPREPRMERK